MKVKIINPHHHYSLGIHEVSEDRGNYLVRIGVAEKVEAVVIPKKEITTTTEKAEVKAPKKNKIKAKKEKNEL